MLNVPSNIALTTAATDEVSLTAIAMGLAILALLISLVAMSRARRAGNAAKVAVDEALTAAEYPVGTPAMAPAAAPEAADDRQLVAVISAAISAILADEQGAGAAAPRISSIRRIGSAAATPSYARTSSGPYAGFVVRRIRRV